MILETVVIFGHSYLTRTWKLPTVAAAIVVVFGRSHLGRVLELLTFTSIGQAGVGPGNCQRHPVSLLPCGQN